MSAELNFLITGEGPVAAEVRRRGIDRYLVFAEYVRRLPYGRPASTSDVIAVLHEQRGTCSYKHRLLAALAHECGHPEVELVIGLYSMSEQNTPGIGAVLDPAGLDTIPEAHCYLRVLGQRYDFTGLSSGASSPFDALLSEHVVVPEDLLVMKNVLHQETIGKWAELRGISFAEAWALREACIEALALGQL